MILYFDSSSYIKLYVGEEGSQSVRELMATVDLAASSVLLYVEMRGALARAFQVSRIDASEHRDALARFATDWVDFVAIPLSDPVLELAAELAERHFLKALDAIHLASALTLGRRVEFVLSSWDRPLLDAAVAEGIRVISVP